MFKKLTEKFLDFMHTWYDKGEESLYQQIVFTLFVITFTFMGVAFAFSILVLLLSILWAIFGWWFLLIGFALYLIDRVRQTIFEGY